MEDLKDEGYKNNNYITNDCSFAVRVFDGY